MSILSCFEMHPRIGHSPLKNRYLISSHALGIGNPNQHVVIDGPYIWSYIPHPSLYLGNATMKNIKRVLLHLFFYIQNMKL